MSSDCSLPAFAPPKGTPPLDPDAIVRARLPSRLADAFLNDNVSATRLITLVEEPS